MAAPVSVKDIIRYGDNIFAVQKVVIFNPGKGQPSFKTSLRNILTNELLVKTLHPGEKITFVKGLTHKKTSYVCEVDNELMFVDAEGNIDYVAPQLLCKNYQFLTEGMECKLTALEGKIIKVSLPDVYAFPVAEVIEVANRDRKAGASQKEVLLSNGVRVMTPHFIKQGTSIVVDLKTGKYLKMET